LGAEDNERTGKRMGKLSPQILYDGVGSTLARLFFLFFFFHVSVCWINLAHLPLQLPLPALHLETPLFTFTLNVPSRLRR
jgi:hypothetical protein